ncbi:MAG TPA: ABC transporter permease [Vicinamibacteria bacterium]
MSALRRFLLRLHNFLRPGRAEPDLAREVASHLGLLEDELIRRGAAPEEARLAARRAFGGVEQTKELHRDARSFMWLDDARRDLRLAVRTLRRAPGFTAAIVLTLALGVGANTAMFSVISGVVLKPLGYPDADRIVVVLNRWTDTGHTQPNLAGGDEIDISARRGTFDAFAYYQGGEVGVRIADRAEFTGTVFVHPDFFRVFGVPPAAGRLFNRDDAQRSAIVSLGFAERNFGSAAGALEQPLSIGSRPYEIVGVMPVAMRFPARTEVWAAAPVKPNSHNRGGHNYLAVGRLAPGVSLEAANADLSALAIQLARSFPDTNRRKTFVAVPLRDNLVSRVRATLFVMMGAVALVLLIACANVANLILARASGRSRELAVRAALGAGRRHVVSQLLAESLVLALVGGAVGLLFARVGLEILLRFGSRYVPLPRLDDVQTDWRVLLFTVAVSVLTAVAFGLVPARQASRGDVSAALNQSGARGTLGAGSSRIRNGLVVAQIALSFILAINAGLLFRSFAALADMPLGFGTQGILVAYANAPARGSIFDQSGLDDYLRVGQLFADVFARLGQIPGVISAGGAMGLPTGQYDSNGSYAVEGKQTFGGDFHRLPSAGFRLASPGYFRTMAIPVLRGREFDDGDLYERPFVAVISESLARESFGAGDSIGHRIMCGFDSDKWMTIVGVVGDVRQASPASPPGPELYMPLRQHPYAANNVQMVMRTSVAPESLIGAVRQTVRSMRPDVAMKFTTMEASVNDSIAAPRFRMTLVSTFATLALMLAVAGMYAVMSYVTAQRTSEFGLRVALGAKAADVVRLVLRGAARLVAVGVALGLALALATSRIITNMLFGITPMDTPAYAGALLLALPLTFLAAIVPAIRAARVDPMIALREP